MEISSVAAATSGSEASTARLAEDFDQFLLLLTAQLQNQDPLDPLDSNEFVNQLVSFTGVEQSIATNSNLELLIAQNKAGQAASAVSYLGTTIEAKGDRIALLNSEGRFQYDLPENTPSTNISIVNQAGKTVFVGKGDTTIGEHEFVWDGRDGNGEQQPDGIYTIKVSAFNKDDELLSVPTIIGGRVTGVETVDGVVQLIVNGITVPIDEIRSVVESPQTVL